MRQKARNMEKNNRHEGWTEEQIQAAKRLKTKKSGKGRLDDIRIVVEALGGPFVINDMRAVMK